MRVGCFKQEKGKQLFVFKWIHIICSNRTDCGQNSDEFQFKRTMIADHAKVQVGSQNLPLWREKSG